MMIELLASAVALLQEPVAGPVRNAAPGPAGFFRRGLVDFWGDKSAALARAAVGPAGGSRESIWAEPIRQPDGRMSVYVPPKPVLRFLEAPSRDSAREYLAWQEERAKMLKTAMEILRDIRDEKLGAAPPHAEASPQATSTAFAHSPHTSSPATAAKPIPPVEILYFKKKGCPWCAEEDKALGELTATRPEIRIRVATPESDPQLWAEHGVKVVPTLVIPAPAGRKVTLRGYMPAGQILRVLEEVNRAAP